MPQAEQLCFIGADWPAPATVRAIVSTRRGGCSGGAWRSLNLAQHVGDDPEAVRRNRDLLTQALDLPAQPQWLEQVHGSVVVDAAADGLIRVGDAAYTGSAGVVCAVLTADCLPVMLCNRSGTEIAVAHCGWRGLVAGVLGATLQRFRCEPADLIAWLGPAIGPAAFEVGPEVKQQFVGTARGQTHRAAIEGAFLPLLGLHPSAETGRGSACGGHVRKYRADLYALARAELQACGLNEVHGGGLCTFGDAERFFSYRRDGQSGRMASLIWIAD